MGEIAVPLLRSWAETAGTNSINISPLRGFLINDRRICASSLLVDDDVLH